MKNHRDAAADARKCADDFAAKSDAHAHYSDLFRAKDEKALIAVEFLGEPEQASSPATLIALAVQIWGR